MRYVVQFGRFLVAIAGLLAVASLSGCPPFADFMAVPTEGDAPLEVQFTAQPGEGSSEIQSFLWDFGDGSQSVDENPVHTFVDPGFYRVSLTVTNNNGASTETKEAFINVRARPDAAFSANPVSGNRPLTVQFLDESVTEPFEATAWRWTFGDGEISTEQNPVHEYIQPGAYDVSLTVTTDGGSDTETQPGFIRVSAAPAVSFEASATAGNLPLSVAFTDTSNAGTAEITEWFWEFGDGNTSTEQSPTHVYDTAGIYSVALTARSEVGETTRTETNLITVTEAPTAAFTGAPREGGAPLVVSFTDESATGSSPITRWLWDFGDGTSSQQRNPIHEFTEPGEYDISLTVTTDAGTKKLVRENYVVAQQPPTADFTASIVRGEAPLTVAFSDISVAGDSPITGRQWNFGDGTFSGEERPVHVFSTPGTYAITLRVESAVGSNQKVEQDFITVVARPTASFTASSTAGETPLTVNFTDTSTPGSSPITEWLWEFGDGTTSDQQHPTRVYNAAGLYTVTLKVTTDEGTSTSMRNDLINVVKGPRADFTATPTGGAAPLSVQFRDASDTGSEEVVSRAWDFGDGNTSSSEDPLHIYDQPGIYTVSLTVTTEAGPDTEQKVGYITVDPAVSFTLTPATGTVPRSISFTDTTTAYPLTITGWEWDFGDGATSTVQNPVHTYTDAGSYDVSLTVTTDQGNASTTRLAAVRLRPQVMFSGEPVTGAGAPHVVQFTDTTLPGNLAIRAWDWNFGDGTHSTQQNPAHTFLTPDVYDVTLTVQTDIGNSATTKAEYVVVRPEAAFSASATNGVDTLAVQFTDETDPGNLDILTWAWDFGDGTTSGMQHPAHTYTQAGTYTVRLTTGSTEGSDTETKAGFITVMPNVTFTGTPVTGQPPLEVTFTDTTNTGTLTTSARIWELGEGDPSMDEMPMVTYEAYGNYDVTLTITTEQGEAFRTRTGYIKVVPALDTMAALVPGSGTASVTFTNNTDTGDLTDVTWLWDFDDGTTSTEAAPSHVFTSPGIYDVRLTMNSAEGVTTTETELTVQIAPLVSFTATPNGGTAPLDVQFNDTSTVGSLTITNWAWDFDDGMMGAGANPMHTYSADGTYMVSLTITTELGETSIDLPNTVTVTPAPPMSVSTSLTPDTVPDNGQAGIAFDLSASATVQLESLLVYLGPGAVEGPVQCFLSDGGAASDPAAWALLQTVDYDGTGSLVIPMAQAELVAGERIGVCILTSVLSDMGPGLLYETAKPGEPAPVFSDGVLQISGSMGKGPGTVNALDGITFEDRWFVGTVNYRCLDGCEVTPVPDALSAAAAVRTRNEVSADGTFVIESRGDDGEVAWTYEDGNTEYVAFTAAPENAVYVLSADGYIPVVTKLHADGNVLWQSVLTAAPSRVNWGLFVTSDGGVGVYGSADSTTADSRVWEVRLDGDGIAVAGESE